MPSIYDKILEGLFLKTLIKNFQDRKFLERERIVNEMSVPERLMVAGLLLILNFYLFIKLYFHF